MKDKYMGKQMGGNPLRAIHLGIFTEGDLSEGNSRDINANVNIIYWLYLYERVKLFVKVTFVKILAILKYFLQTGTQ